jgi:dipeptidase D
MEIQTGRGNSIKIMNRLLLSLSEKYSASVSKFDAGSKHNAIPRESFASIVIPNGKKEEAVAYVSSYNEIVKAELATNEPGLKVEIVPSEMPQYILPEKVQKGLLLSLYAAPHGVLAWSADIPGLVETSTNLAIIKTEENSVNLTTSQRSSVSSAKDDAAAMVKAAFSLGGAEVEASDGYPGWKPNVKSPVLGIVKSQYEKLFNKVPEVKAIHAGLETGIIIEKYPDMDMISFGPTILGAHSPEERAEVATVGKFWELLKAVLVNIPKK